MFTLSPGKLLILAVIVIAIFGYRKLPEVGKGIGQAIRNFRQGISEPDEIDITPTQEEAREPEKIQPSVKPAATAAKRPPNRAFNARKRS